MLESLNFYQQENRPMTLTRKCGGFLPFSLHSSQSKQMGRDRATSCSSSSTENSNQLKWNLSTDLRNWKTHYKIKNPDSENLNLEIPYHKIKKIQNRNNGKEKKKERNCGQKIEKLTSGAVDGRWRLLISDVTDGMKSWAVRFGEKKKWRCVCNPRCICNYHPFGFSVDCC